MNVLTSEGKCRSIKLFVRRRRPEVQVGQLDWQVLGSEGCLRQPNALGHWFVVGAQVGQSDGPCPRSLATEPVWLFLLAKRGEAQKA